MPTLIFPGSASEATLMTLLAARSKAIRAEREKNPNISNGEMIDRLVAYTSQYSHCSVKRAGE